jgi:opacity protein-like surface antigen
MELKRYSRERAVIIAFGIMLLLSITAFAQETRSEISVQGTGFFTKDSNNNGVQNHNTESGGVLVGYRYNINRWLSAEANYGWTRNSQQYFGSFGPAAVRANVHQVTGAGIVSLPTIARLRPYVMAGGGALVFDPTDAASNFLDATQQTRGAFLYGGGVDYNLTRHLGLRAEYRGFVYKQPNFNLRGLDSDAWTHTAQPSAGVVLKF